MKLRKFRILGQDIVIGKRLFGLGKDENYWGEVTNYGTDTRNYNRLDTYKGLVYACIHRVAESSSAYEPIIYRRKQDQWEDIGDHEFLRLLRRPGGLDDKAIPITLSKLIYATVSFILLQGDCYWYMAKGQNSGKPREIVILRADKVGKKLDDNGDIDYFFVRTTSGDNIRIEIDEMLPFVGFNPKDAYSGLGTVEAAQDYIQTDEYSTAFTKNFFRNNAGVNGVLELKGEVTGPGFRKFVRQWREKYEGVDNAGKLAIIRASDASFTKVGLGLDELNMEALRKMSREDICAMFGVPKALLGLSDETGLGRGNVETFEYIFAKYTIEPKMKMFDETLQFALERYWGETDLRMGHLTVIPEDKEFELQERIAATDKWMTRDEIRDEDGLDSVEGGDQLFVPMANVPLSEASTSSTPPPTPPSKGLVIRRRVVIKTTKDMNVENKEAFRLSLLRYQALYERRYKKKFKPILIEQRAEALRNLEAHASALNKDLKLFDDADADAKMVDEIVPILRDMAKQQGALALVFAGDEESEFVLTQNFESILTHSTRSMAKNFNDETLARLNKTLAEGIANNESLGKLKKRIEEVYGKAQGYRTERIARTETLKASNNATEAAYQQTGYVKEKQWYANPGACEFCQSMDGQTVPLGDSFLELGQSVEGVDENGEPTGNSYAVDYETVENADLHPNCECTIVPVR